MSLQIVDTPPCSFVLSEEHACPTRLQTRKTLAPLPFISRHLQGTPIREPVDEVASQPVPEQSVLVGLVDHPLLLRQARLDAAAGDTKKKRRSSPICNDDHKKDKSVSPRMLDDGPVGTQK